MQDYDYEELLAQQLRMNRQTWVALQGHGVTEATELRLDFSYNAPDRESADALSALLRDETDYDVRVESDSAALQANWRVEGTTQTTTISPEILDEWLAWMVTAGREKNCEFDGWGTSV